MTYIFTQKMEDGKPVVRPPICGEYVSWHDEAVAIAPYTTETSYPILTLHKVDDAVLDNLKKVWDETVSKPAFCLDTDKFIIWQALSAFAKALGWDKN